MAVRPRTLDTMITWLEMTAPPTRHHPLPLGVNAAILHAVRPQLSFYRFLQFQVGHPWHWESRLRMDDDKLSNVIHAETTEIYVLYLDGAPAGFFEVNRADPAVTDLAYFGLMPHAAGRGLGRWFLGQAVEACWANKPQRVTVNTCTLDHPAALPLYQKLGFRPYNQTPGKVRPLTKADIHRLAEQGVVGATAPKG
ncbi:GNAT family N-acetyltransferase [Oricola thermophila]|uniref:GNAT family N-acetyltransferase n=1 Tax=Oricola thermophila TaxID=2742145 RepID=A0A6N1V9V2_9HYPH|nr:GNAT family N-acetyltransferase [Oricola thermophila]QKV17726.1 GNAT family N-acetyltransferase [Oricola thermophila]